MGIASELRESVLQAAIQGKLTEQLASDGNARDLLKQIKAEKDKLIADKKIKKEKAFAPISDDEKPFDIPDNWEWCKLGECINLTSGQDLTPNDYNSNGNGTIYLTGASNINSDGTIVINRWTTNPKSMAYKDNLLFTCKGTVGTMCFLKEEKVHIARQIMAIDGILVDMKYIHFFMISYVDALKAKAKSIIPGVERKNVLNLSFPLPPLAEQKRIVAKVDELMKEIDKLEKIENELESIKKAFPDDMKSALLQAAMKGELTERLASDGNARDLLKQIKVEKDKLIADKKIKEEKALAPISDDEKPFDIPDNWEWVRVGDIFALTMGQSPDGESVSKGIDGTEFHQGKVFFGENFIQKSDQVTSKPSKIAEPNSVLLCVRAPVGIVNITDRELCIGRGLCAIKSLAGMTAKYTLYSLRCLKDEFIKKATGTTFVAITNEVVKNQLIPLPPLAEQERIVAQLDKLLPLCESLS